MLFLRTKQITCSANNLLVAVLYGLLFIISSKVLEINALYDKYIKNPYSKIIYLPIHFTDQVLHNIINLW